MASWVHTRLCSTPLFTPTLQNQVIFLD
jgi:hypothetical protein